MEFLNYLIKFSSRFYLVILYFFIYEYFDTSDENILWTLYCNHIETVLNHIQLSSVLFQGFYLLVFFVTTLLKFQ